MYMIFILQFDHPLCNMVFLKMIILDNVGVGKTALMYRFLHGVYSDSLPTTVSFVLTVYTRSSSMRIVSVKYF